MKKVKIILWVLIFALMALLFYQNKEFFWNTQQSLRLNLGILPEFNSASLPVIAFFLLFFFFGLVVAYLFALPEKVRNRKTIKKLSASSTAQEQEILQLKSNLGQQASGESSVTSPIKPR
jgi:cell division protein FtsB